MRWLSPQDQARILVLLLLLPHVHEVSLYAEILEPILAVFAAADQSSYTLLCNLFASVQSATTNTVFALQQFLTLRLYSRSSIDTPSISAVHLLDLLHKANSQTADPSPSSIFHNDVINSPEFNLYEDWIRSSLHGLFSFSRYPFLYGPAAKARLLRYQVVQDVRSTASSSASTMPMISMQLGGGVGGTPLLGSLLASALLGGSGFAGMPPSHLVLHVRRGPALVQDALSQIRSAMLSDSGRDRASSSLRRPLRVKFADEQGIDEGGPSREFLQLVVRDCFSPNFGMFTSDPDTRTYWIRASHLHQMLDEFELIGVIVGLAIHNGHTINLSLAPVIFRKLLGASLRLEDLVDVHPDVHRSLTALLQHPADRVEEDMCLNFQVSHEVDFEVEQHNLVPQGGELLVNGSNRDDFVKRYVDFLLVGRVEPQFAAFEKGFYRVCDRKMMDMFKSCPAELEEVVCGTQTRDFEELKRATEYEGDLNSGSDVVRWFWDVVCGFSEVQKRRFLQFVTGNERAPVGGLGSLVPKFKIVKNGEHSHRLPTAHVCFNILLLPEYSSKEWLADRLEKAIEYDQGFGLA